MRPNNDISQDLQARVIDAITQQHRLFIHGGNSKAFYGNPVDCEHNLDVSPHSGIINYEPSELVLTARAGTPITVIEQTLASQRQMLAFEPPIYHPDSTLGGVVAAGLAGPRRMYGGSIRDSVLGVKMINGHGKIVQFGGQVIKNVAGYDVSRLMAGSMGSLGVILEISLKVMPMPAKDITLTLETTNHKAIGLFNQWRPTPLPISASCYYDDCLYIRLSGGTQSVMHFRHQIAGDLLADARGFWTAIRNQTHEFFYASKKPLWRLSLPPSTPIISRLEEHSMIEWNGAQRWLYSNIPQHIIRGIASKHHGHATLFKGHLPGVSRFTPLEPSLRQLHQNLKQAMDPHHIFAAGRLYRDF
ncbi:MAG: glycolate oxidase subunit GlcE [bacterium]